MWLCFRTFSLPGVNIRWCRELHVLKREAAKVTGDGDSIIFDASTTALQVARNIDPEKKAIILTSSLGICITLAQPQL